LRSRAARAPWWPPGYELIADGVAYQALAPNEYSCDLFGCLKIRVVTREGCGTLYIEEKIYDARGQVVDFSNDVLSGLAPNEVGIMEFTVTDDGPHKLRITDVTCD
jgi:hypothetical protein